MAGENGAFLVPIGTDPTGTGVLGALCGFAASAAVQTFLSFENAEEVPDTPLVDQSLPENPTKPGIF